VMAIDVDSFQAYDWGYNERKNHIPEKIPVEFENWKGKAEGFWYLHSLFKSKVKRKNISVYDLNPKKHGQFDVIFMYGLLYHLRHPLLALDKIREVCKGIVILETHILNHFRGLPASVFYMDDIFKGRTNWHGPNIEVVASWLYSAGFPFIYTIKPINQNPERRQVFIASISDDWSKKFINNTDLLQLDINYFKRLRPNISALLKPNKPTKSPNLLKCIIKKTKRFYNLFEK
jgi:tRNA (mo5U34)-methyltransferase